MENLIALIRNAIHEAKIQGWSPTVIYLNQEYDDFVAYLKAKGQRLDVDGVPVRQGMRNGVLDDDGRYVNF